MRPKEALRWAFYYRVLATASFLVGATIAGVGLWFGLVPALGVLVANVFQPDVMERTVAAVDVPVVVVSVVVGAFVWQFGSAVGYYWTLGSAVEAAVEGATGGPAEGRPTPETDTGPDTRPVAAHDAPDAQAPSGAREAPNANDTPAAGAMRGPSDGRSAGRIESGSTDAGEQSSGDRPADGRDETPPASETRSGGSREPDATEDGTGQEAGEDPDVESRETVVEDDQTSG